MITVLHAVLPPVFMVAAVIYLGLAATVSRSRPRNLVAWFLFLIGVLIAGSAFSYGAQDAHLYGIGRTLSYFAGGFIPVAFYAIYREYTSTRPGPVLIAALSVIPILTTLLTITNSMHNMFWDSVEASGVLIFSELTNNFWFTRVHQPFAYGLFGFSLASLVGRMHSIAPAHRRVIRLLIICATLPFLVSIANTLLGIGPRDFPFLSSSLVILLPLYAYASISLRVYEFSPVAYQALFDHVQDPIIVLDCNEFIICANRKATGMLGKPESELLGQKLWQDVPLARAVLKQASDLNLTQTLRFDTSEVYEVSVAPMRDSIGRQQGTVVICRDVTERRKAQSQLADSEHLIRTLIETSSNGILRFSRDESSENCQFRCTFANRAAELLLSTGGESLIGKCAADLAQMDPDKLLEHFSDPASADSPISFETVAEGSSGEAWVRVVGEPVGEDFSVTLIDITQRKQTENKMLADALRDPLTGVLNRRGFEKEATACIRQSAKGAVVYLDLNHFKTINDRFGHQAGDALLKAFGHRLEFCLRPEDILGRLGGDEFSIILPGVSVDDARHIADRLVSTASEAYIIQGQEISCSASVGVALMPQHGEELWHLISVADAAMYDVKKLSADEAANDRAAHFAKFTAEERR